MFRKTIAKYYHQWLKDSLDSAVLCESRGNIKEAEVYLNAAIFYEKIIKENKEVIEFFSQEDNAFLRDEALPEKFRGY